MEKTLKKEVELSVYASNSTLPSSDLDLLKQAKSALVSSYAPYSKFHVAAAVLLENGKVVIGSNQENMAYPSGLCAERVAVFSASAQYPGVAIQAIAITANSETMELDHPIMCCGACLQSICEYESRYQNSIRLILQGNTGPVYIANGTQTFLPFQFDGSALKKL